jgi:hypothetical protein
MRTLILAAFALALPAGAASAASCEALWYARNTVYRNAGYCFKTQRAIQAFGNSGCEYDRLEDVPLSRADHAEVGAIQAEEAARRCPR